MNDRVEPRRGTRRRVERKLYRVGPDCETWPKNLTGNTYWSPEDGPQFGSTLYNFRSATAPDGLSHSARPSTHPPTVPRIRVLPLCGSAAGPSVAPLPQVPRVPAGGRADPAGRRPRAHRLRPGEEDAALAQKSGQRQPFIAVSQQDCVGQLASFRPA